MSKARRRTNRSRLLSRSAKRHATRRILRAESLENRMLLAGNVLPLGIADATPYHNNFRPTDVNEDHTTSAVDALMIINQLNATGPMNLAAHGGEGEEAAETSVLGKIDTSGDNMLSPIDVLNVINALNAEGEHGADHILEIGLKITDTAGNDINGQQVQVGDTVSLTGTVQDLRGFSSTGVFASYFDINYNNGNLFEVDFGETQTLTFSSNISNVGTFTLTFDGKETGDIPLVGDLRTATTNNIRTALEGLDGIEPGDVVVAHRPSTGNADPMDDNNFIWQMTFFKNLGMQNIDELEVDPSNLSGTGGAVTATVVETFPADINNADTFRLAFKPQAPYTDGLRAGNGSDDNQFDEVGTFTRVVPDVLTDVYPFVSVNLILKEPGTLTFSGEPADVKPDSEVLVFGDSEEVPTELIDYPDQVDEIVSITIIKPVEANDDEKDVIEHTASAVIDVLNNDVVLTGGTLVVDSVTQGSQGGTVTVTNNGADVTYEPPFLHFFGIETFNYTVTDGLGDFDTATVTVTVIDVNDDPTAVDDALTVAEDSDFTPVNVLDNDSIAPDEGSGETLTVVSASSQSGAPVTVDSGVNYKPLPDFFGSDTVTYTISDGRGGTADATIDVTVTPVNDDPIAANDGVVQVNEDSSANTIAVLSNDVVGPANEVDDTLEITSVTTATVGASVSIVNGTEISYSPPTDFFGTDTFTYTITDNSSLGALTDTATVTINVNNVNDDPDAIDDAFNFLEDSIDNVVPVLDNDLFEPDPQENLVVTDVTQPDVGGTVVLNQDGEVIYTPDNGFTETSTFTYDISDGNGGSDTATVVVTVDPLEIPRARSDQEDVEEDSTDNTFTVLDDDLAHDGFTLKITGIDTASLNTVGQVSFDDTTITYTPPTDFFGTDKFTYTIDEFDDQGNVGGMSDGPATATVTVNVLNLNDDPTADDDSFSFDEDSGTNNLDVVANDDDAPDANETLLVSLINGSAGPVSTSLGTISIASGGQSIDYTPNDDAFGSDTFTYTIDDGNGGSDSATVSINIDAVNDDPTAGNDDLTIDEDSGQNSLLVLTNDTIDPDINETITINDVGNSQVGATIGIAGDGQSILYTPPQDFFGDDTFSYTIDDGNGGEDTATVSLTIDNVNDDPVANDDFDANDPQLILKDTEDNLINVVDNDEFLPDPQEDLIVLSVADGAFGTTEISSDGKGVLYTPNQGVDGEIDTFTYTLSDQNGGTDTATVTVEIVNFVSSNVTGYSFFDSNGDNGSMDDGDFGISGSTIWLRGSNLLDEDVELSTTTNEHGFFAFNGVIPGDYTLSGAQPKYLDDGLDKIGNQGGDTFNDRFDFSLDIFGSDAKFNFFGESGVAAEFITLQEILSSTPDTGAVVAMNGSSRYWYTMLEGWEGYSDVSVTAASDYSYIDVTATNGSTSTRRIFASENLYHLMGVAEDGVIFRLKGTSSDFGFDDVTAAEGEYHDSEQAEGESASEEEELRMLAENGDGEGFRAAVDEIMKAYA